MANQGLPRNEDLEKIANQMLDRTEALDVFIRGLQQIDPAGSSYSSPITCLRCPMEQPAIYG